MNNAGPMIRVPRGALHACALAIEPLAAICGAMLRKQLVILPEATKAFVRFTPSSAELSPDDLPALRGLRLGLRRASVSTLGRSSRLHLWGSGRALSGPQSIDTGRAAAAAKGL